MSQLVSIRKSNNTISSPASSVKSFNNMIIQGPNSAQNKEL